VLFCFKENQNKGVIKEIHLTAFVEEYGVNIKVCKSEFLLIVSCRREKELIILLRRTYTLYFDIKVIPPRKTTRPKRNA
jgi:hypothetical protein